MPNITFSSPMHKDKTIYAVAGSHTQTILKLAKEKYIVRDEDILVEYPSR
jgi:hypothetical protein